MVRGGTLHRDNWTLREATASDIEELMQWFPEEDDVVVWGGPKFRYPFTRESFFEDIHWRKMATFCLHDESDDYVGFGQLYNRNGRIHLARLIVRPDMRGRGAGRRLIELLIEAGAIRSPGDEYSLFVLRENSAALGCYKSLGFVIGEYPRDMPHADVCYYLTRPAELEET